MRYLNISIILSFLFLIFFNNSAEAQCLNTNYCSSEGENTAEEYISYFEINTLINSTPDQPDSGYSDFTGSTFTTTLATYAGYDVTMTPEFPGQSFNEYFRIWIDYNQDGNFDDTELAFNAGQTTQQTITGQIIIPADALLGLTRLRVVMRFDNGPNPCGEYNYGETEDYCVTIIEGVPVCNAPEPGLLTASSIGEGSAILNWGSDNVADSYIVNYRAVGAPDWLVGTSNTIFLSVNDLLDCTEYEYKVAGECTGIGMSDFSETDQFMTICSCPVPTSLDTMSVSSESAIVNWEASANGESYELQYKLTSGSVNAWTNKPTNNIIYTLDGLLPCSEYEYQVRSICQNNESQWSESLVFNTVCLSLNTEIANGLNDLEVYPNPFDDNFSLRFDLSKNLEITLALYNSTGQLIFNKKQELGTGTNNLIINGLTGQSAGVYFIAISTNQGTIVRRIVKQS